MKKILWFVFLFLFCVSVLLVYRSYSLLETKGNGEKTLAIGKWNIYINDINVVQNQEITFSDLNYEENEHIEDNYFAPGRRATYDIIIDPKDTDVSTGYTISIDSSALQGHDNIIFQVEDVDQQQVLNLDEMSYQGIISLADIQNQKKVHLKIILWWKQDDNYNEKDNELLGNLSNLKIPISIHFEQNQG